MAKKKEETKINSNLTLYRSETNKVVAGVCGGLGEFFNIDPTIIRLLFVVIALFGGSSVIIYIILWLVMPTNESGMIVNKENLKKNAEEMKDEVKKMAANVQSYSKKHDPRVVFGAILIFLGLFWLFDSLGFFRFFDLTRLWPVLLIAFGVYIVYKDK